MSIILALLAAIFAALTSIFAKIGMTNVHSNLATAIRTIVVFIMALFIVFVTNHMNEVFSISYTSWLFLIISGLSTGLSWLFYFKALSIGEVSKVVAIDKSSIVITILLSFLILGEEITTFVLIGGTFISIGTFVLIGKQNKTKLQHSSNSYIVPALLAAFFAAITTILAKIGIENVDSNVATLIRTFVIIIFAWGIVFYEGRVKDIRKITKKELLFLVLSGSATGLSWLCFFAAISLGKVSVVAPIDKFSVVIVMILSYFILKEKQTKKTVAGAVLITIGTVFLVI